MKNQPLKIKTQLCTVSRGRINTKPKGSSKCLVWTFAFVAADGSGHYVSDIRCSKGEALAYASNALRFLSSGDIPADFCRWDSDVKERYHWAPSASHHLRSALAANERKLGA